MISALRSLREMRLSGRGRKFGLFFVSSIGSRGVGIACQLLQVPIALKAMGAEAFGLWMTLSSFTYLLNFADLGVGVGVQNKLAEMLGFNEERKARALFNSAFAFLLAIGLGLALLLIPATLLFNPERIFGLKEASVIAQAHEAVVAMLLWFWPRPSAGELYASAQPLLESDNPADWDKAWDDYLEPLSTKYPGEYAEEVRVAKAKLSDRRKLRRAIDDGAKIEFSGDGERLYARGLAFAQVGDGDEAERTWKALPSKSGDERWWKLAQIGLAELAERKKSREKRP